MTGGFDEWALARTPSLLAFASALVEDHGSADEAVTRALSRLRESWWRSSREEPDLEARRLVVRSCSTPRRGAVVLRTLEGRTDSEIAEVLRCSEAAVRRHLHRGLAETGPRSSPALLGSGDHGGAAPTVLLAPPAPMAVRATGRRSRATWVTTVAVLALVGGVSVLAHESRSRSEALSYPRTPVPSSWRYESYRGVQLQVPGDWGWGASPIRADSFRSPGHLGACGTAGAIVTPPGPAAGGWVAPAGFVGRPVMVTERCMSWGSEGAVPTGDGVWFDSPFPVGQKPLGPTVAETREVGGLRVTAFSAQPALRRQILGTAGRVGVDAHGCPTRPLAAPTAGPHDLEPSGLSVCVYSQDTGASSLLYSTLVSAGAARAYAERVAAAAPAHGSPCGTPSGRWVALGLHGSGGVRWDVVDLGCGAVRTGPDGTRLLTADSVRDWATDGIPAYVNPPRAADAALRQLLRAPTA